MQCPLLYRFRVIDRLPETPARRPRAARVVHAVLERLFDLPADRADPGGGRALLGAEWERLRSRGAGAGASCSPTTRAALAGWLTGAEGLVERGSRWRTRPGSSPPSGSSTWRRSWTAGCGCAATSTGSTWRPTGEMRIVDYKTGRAPPESFEAKALFQMKFYALVLWRLRGVVPRLLQLVYLGRRRSAALRPRRGRPAAPPSARCRRCGRRSSGPRRRATGGRARAGCATGATTGRCARSSAGTPPPPPDDALERVCGPVAAIPQTRASTRSRAGESGRPGHQPLVVTDRSSARAAATSVSVTAVSPASTVTWTLSS